MRRYYFLLLLVIPFSANSQRLYSSLNFAAYHNNQIDFGGAVTGSIGTYLTEGLHVGLGGGAFIFQDDVYLYPIFGEIGYLNSKTKISPFGRARLGYGFYNGPGTKFGRVDDVRGRFYGDFSAGISLRAWRVNVSPYAGLSLFLLNDKLGDNDFLKPLFNIGLCISFYDF